MTHVSRKKLPLALEKTLNEALISLLSKNQTTEIQKILSTLFTKTEKIMLYKRLGIVYLLNEEKNIDEIMKATGTTRQTVDRIRLQLLEVPDENIEFFTKKLNSWKNIKLFESALKEVFEKLLTGSKLVHKKHSK